MPEEDISDGNLTQRLYGGPEEALHDLVRDPLAVCSIVWHQYLSDQGARDAEQVYRSFAEVARKRLPE